MSSPSKPECKSICVLNNAGIRPTLPAEELMLARAVVIVGWMKVIRKNATVSSRKTIKNKT